MDDFDPYTAGVNQLQDEVIRLQALVADLRNQEALKNIAEGEVKELNHKLNDERWLTSYQADTIDALVTDVSLMEDQIRELRGRDELTPDYE